MKINWDYEIPNIWKVIKFMFQKTNQLHCIIWKTVINPMPYTTPIWGRELSYDPFGFTTSRWLMLPHLTLPLGSTAARLVHSSQGGMHTIEGSERRRCHVHFCLSDICFFSETCLLGGWFLVWTCIYIYIYIYIYVYIYICTYMYIKAITRVFTLVNRYSSRAATSIGHQRAWSSPVFPDSSWEPRQPPLDG